jgi:hypothetical protein
MVESVFEGKRNMIGSAFEGKRSMLEQCFRSALKAHSSSDLERSVASQEKKHARTLISSALSGLKAFSSSAFDAPSGDGARFSSDS